MKICELLLQFLLLTVNISFWVLVSALNSIGLLQRSSSRFKKFSLECFAVDSSFIWKKKRKISWNGHSLTLAVTCGTTRCHSLSLFVIRCTTRCHSLSLVATRCTTRLSFYKRSSFSATSPCSGHWLTCFARKGYSHKRLLFSQILLPEVRTEGIHFPRNSAALVPQINSELVLFAGYSIIQQSTSR